MNGVLEQALRELLSQDGEDHRRVNDAQRSALGISLQPVDPELADLARELSRLRRADPEATAMALLSDAASSHAAAVERHLAWLESRALEVIRRLPDRYDTMFQLVA